MITKAKQKELSKNLRATNENLQEAYLFLCSLQAVKPGKIKFKKVNKELGRTKMFGLKIPFTKKILFKRFRLEISPRSDWLRILFHEFAHQLRMNDKSDQLHSPHFFAIQAYLYNEFFFIVYKQIFRQQKL